MFRDEAVFTAIGGRGGDGSVHFRREKYIPRGGPDGGDGGAGGSVILEADENTNTLLHFLGRDRIAAADGNRGEGKNCYGRSAEDTIWRVPVGTIVRDGRDGRVMADLRGHGDKVIAARGGKGGKGNFRFKSSTHQTPREFTPGEEGEINEIVLELRLIADVGLVGLPNAGKSTLLSVLSAARPKIAAYPFTTLEPQLGIVDLGEYRTFVMADVPGLIEGAHEGAGLGTLFLRHIERTRVLLHLVDLLPQDGTYPADNVRKIRTELAAYSPLLAAKPTRIVGTKAELPGAEESRQLLEMDLREPVLAISSITRGNLKELLTAVRSMLDDAPPPEPYLDDDLETTVAIKQRFGGKKKARPEAGETGEPGDDAEQPMTFAPYPDLSEDPDDYEDFGHDLE